MPPTGEWSGVVKSDKNSCQKDRYVELFRRAGKENIGVGNTVTVKDGQKWVWELPTLAKQLNGKYFALAAPTEDCKRAESKIFDYPEDNPPPRALKGSRGAAKARVVLTISAWEPVQIGLGVWRGRVKSIRTKCMKDAEVTLYYSTGEDNAAIGDAEIKKKNGKFFWEVVSGEPADGEYFALAKPSNACKRAESPGFDYPKGRRALADAASATRAAQADTKVTIT